MLPFSKFLFVIALALVSVCAPAAVVLVPTTHSASQPTQAGKSPVLLRTDLPGISRPILGGKMAKQLFVDRAYDVYALVDFQTSYGRSLRVMQPIAWGAPAGAFGTHQDLTAEARSELIQWISTRWQTLSSERKWHAAAFSLVRNRDGKANQSPACAWVRSALAHGSSIEPAPGYPSQLWEGCR